MSQEFENELEESGSTFTTKAPKAVNGDSKRGILPGTKPEGWEITLPNPVFSLNLDELAAKMGPEKLLAMAKAMWVIKAQAAIRAMAEAGISDEEISIKMQSWNPGDRLTEKLSPEQAILKNFGNMTPEQKARVMASLEQIASS